MAGVSGDDLDVPGYVQAHDPETGEMQWRWYVVPQKKGEPGSETWPNEDAMKHGGGMTWQPFTYDPELNQMYVTTGNPQPVIAHVNRAGANLFTASIVSLNPDTGQDELVLPVLAARHARLGLDADGGALRRPDQRPDAQAGRAGGAQRPLLRARSHQRHGDRLVGVRQDQLGVRLRREGPAGARTRRSTRRSTARSSRRIRAARRTGRRRLSARRPGSSTSTRRARSACITSTIRATIRWAGAAPIAAAGRSDAAGDRLQDRARSSGATRGKADRAPGLLSTAGNLLFSGGASSDLVALNATTGEPLWHAGLNASVSNGAITYELDGSQYVIVGCRGYAVGVRDERPAAGKAITIKGKREKGKGKGERERYCPRRWFGRSRMETKISDIVEPVHRLVVRRVTNRREPIGAVEGSELP